MACRRRFRTTDWYQVELLVLSSAGGNPQQLVDALDTIMMHSTMSASMKNTIVTTVTNVSSANPALRTQTRFT